jgi:alkylation response protein AidB-like acyl-CoA dehydrogenase
MSEVTTIIEKIATGPVRQNAVEVDRSGSFPQKSIDALKEAGLLGLVSSKEVGGKGLGIRAAAEVVGKLAEECASTAMVMCMHLSGATVLEKFGPESVRKAIAKGDHLSTLAFSEVGSRSHFWASLGSAKVAAGGVELFGKKSWVTSGSNATAYVWSSKPVSAEGASTIWLVPRSSKGLRTGERFDGLGLRGNDSVPVTAEGVVVPTENRLGNDGQGLDIMLGTVLPIFNVMASACAIGIMEGATAAASAHASGTRYEHLSQGLNELPTIRAYLARMRIGTDQVKALIDDTITALETGRADAQLRVLESKASAGESATTVLDIGMRVCGGSAFRKEVGVERRFRDARAGTVMAPTTDQLYDFIGKAITGLPVL